MHNRSFEKWNTRPAFVARAIVVILLGSGIGGADEGQQSKDITPAKVEVRALEILPLYDAEDYEGRFLFINHGKQPLKLDCSERPVGQRYLPNSIQFQILKNGIWEKIEHIEGGWCWPYDIPPGVPCELDVDLESFKEQNTPLTCRVIFNWDKYPSEPFVLDWKSDRKAGKFQAAQKAHVEKMRAAFLKSGFRPELLKGDDFPLQIVKEMIARVTKSGEVGAWFGLFREDMKVDARLFWKGDVFIEFQSFNDDCVGYSGHLRWNPDSLSRALLRKLRKANGEVSVSEKDRNGSPNGFFMAIDPDDPVYPGTIEWIIRPFVMSWALELPKDSALPMPGKEEPMKAFDSAMDFLEDCLIHEEVRDVTPSSGNSRSAPIQPPKSQPPSQPGSAPKK